MFKIKDGYELKLQTLETMKLFGSTFEIAVAVAKLYGDKIVIDENPRNI